MTITYAFDVYGTLIDPLAMASHLTTIAEDKAPQIASLWREKQLEYTFRRGLMRAYVPFDQVTAEALDFASESAGVSMTREQKGQLLTQYRTLDAFPDTAPALQQLRTNGHAMWAFSNGTPQDLGALLTHADVLTLLDGVVSVNEVQSFKPDPAVYARFCERANSEPDQTCLVSSNPFDVIGATNCGWQTVWVKRTDTAQFDPWSGFAPDRIIASLRELTQT
ncbi:MAG: haloacid dehalogenase type II [Pseudomonadota bacterium]